MGCKAGRCKTSNASQNAWKIQKLRDPFFSTNYLDNYLHVADQGSELSHSTQANELERLKIQELRQKTACLFLEDFLVEINVAFTKSDDILCAFEVLNVDNCNKQQINLFNPFELSIQINVAFMKTGGISYASEVLNVDNLNKQHGNLFNPFEPSIQVLANF